MIQKISGTLEVHNCPVCFIQYAAPEALYEARRRDGKDFYCPNGHALTFKDNEHDRTRRERDRLKQDAARLEDELRLKNLRMAEEIDARHKVEREAKRLKKRAAAGVCSCCNRTFTNMAQHMKTQHPEMLAENVTKLKGRRK